METSMTCLKTLLGVLALLCFATPSVAQIQWNQPAPADNGGYRMAPPDTRWDAQPRHPQPAPAPQGRQRGSGGDHILLQNGGLEGTVPVPVANALNPLLTAHNLPTVQNWVASGREVTNILRLVTLAQICAITRPTPARFDDSVSESDRIYRRFEGTAHSEACELVDYVSNQLVGNTTLGRQAVGAVPLPTGATRDNARAQLIGNWENIKHSLSVMLQKERGTYRP
jgi:hypothetical protein